MVKKRNSRKNTRRKCWKVIPILFLIYFSVGGIQNRDSIFPYHFIRTVIQYDSGIYGKKQHFLGRANEAVNEIYIVTGRTDMRKSIDGLCAIVEDQLHMDPGRSALYLFCGKRCDRIIALIWESDGFVLLYKRMEVQGRFCRPRNQLEVKQLTWQQLDWLMSGLEIEQSKAFKPTE